MKTIKQEDKLNLDLKQNSERQQTNKVDRQNRTKQHVLLFYLNTTLLNIHYNVLSAEHSLISKNACSVSTIYFDVKISAIVNIYNTKSLRAVYRFVCYNLISRSKNV